MASKYIKFLRVQSHRIAAEYHTPLSVVLPQKPQVAVPVVTVRRVK